MISISATWYPFQLHSFRFSNMISLSATFGPFQQHDFYFSNILSISATGNFSNILSKVDVASSHYKKITNFSATFLSFPQRSFHFSNILLNSATFLLFQQYSFRFSNIPGHVAENFFSNMLSKVGVPTTSYYFTFIIQSWPWRVFELERIFGPQWPNCIFLIVKQFTETSVIRLTFIFCW